MDDHLAKPLNREALARCLAQHLDVKLSTAADG